jgi:hypothetical protein
LEIRAVTYRADLGWFFENHPEKNAGFYMFVLFSLITRETLYVDDLI